MKKPTDESRAGKRPADERPANERDSGQPGGGAGRRDEVGGSGVYPASGPHPDSGDAPLRGQASWGQGDRGAEGYNDSGTSEVHDMAGELPKDQQQGSQGSSGQGEGGGQRSAGQGERGGQRSAGQGEPGGQQSSGRGGARRDDPNRQPGDQDLYNEDTQGNVFYDKNTEIKRETEFHNSTAADIGSDEKVDREHDQFGKQKK